MKNILYSVLVMPVLVLAFFAQTAQAATPVYSAPVTVHLLPVASKPTWNIPDMQAKPTPFIRPNYPSKSSNPQDGFNFLALPVSTHNELLIKSPQVENSLTTQATPSSYTLLKPVTGIPETYTTIGVLGLPTQTERLFVDMDNQIARELIDSLDNPQAQLLDNNGQAVQNWLDNYDQTHLGLANTTLPKQLFIVKTTVDSYNVRQPSTLNGWVKWLASDTMPNTLQYRLVTYARLLDTRTGRLIWQSRQQVTIPNQQLTSLSRQSSQVTGNQLALGQAAKKIGNKLASQYLLANKQLWTPQHLGHEALNTLKSLPGLTLQQLMP